VQHRLPRQRADASRNYDLIVAAARELFVEHGPGVPLDEIAHRAGVGNATLYRHFANRSELLRVVILSLMSGVAEQTERALAEEQDPFEALRRFVHESADGMIGGLCAVFSDCLDPDDHEVHLLRERLMQAVESVLQRARESGQVRTDIGVGDVLVPIIQLTRPIPGTGRAALDRFAHRHLEILLDGLRASPQRSVLPGCTATLEDLRQSVERLTPDSVSSLADARALTD
jgi:AcrR family transcriptional regulator